MADVTKINGYIIKDANAPHPSNAGSAGQVLKKTETGTEWADVSFKPEGKSYLTFSSPNSFTLKVNDTTKHWDGTLEYFASNRTWTTWDGTTTLSAVENDGENVLYLRGTGNTVITGNNSNYRWVFTGSNISCTGNIENLLDYATVTAGNHPTMANYCYYCMFYGCTALTQAPALPATTLSTHCYSGMFYGCTSLTQAPALPAMTLSDYCYESMFYGCTSLTQAPALPATTLATYCYYYMFQGCTSLTQAPALPATTLSTRCYRSMFMDCTSLTQAPALHAMTLADYCYACMFYGCTSLTQAPALPATTMADSCYFGMFQGCTCLKLSSTKTGEYTQEYRIPASGTGTSATNALTDMFISTGGTFTGTPEINTTYYLSSDNMVVRETEIATLNGYVGSMIMVSAIPVNEKGAASGVASLGADGKVPSAQLPEMGGETYTATLLSSGWAQSGSYQKQTVTVTGLKASYPVSPVVDAQLSGTDADGDAAILTAFAAVNILQTAENQLIAYCIGSAPTTNIPLIINTWG